MNNLRSSGEFDFEEQTEEQGSEFHLSEYWGIVVKRARLIILCVALALSVAAIRSLMAKPTYQAAVTIHIGKVTTTPSDREDREAP